MNDISTVPLQRMMKPYEGKEHTVVGFGLQGEDSEVIHRGIMPAQTPASDWIFEIGSITKVFTAILLCVLEEEGDIDPRAPLSELSPELTFVPNEITPERLVTHTSGLPNFFLPVWKLLFSPLQKDPYAHFTRTDLEKWMKNWKHGASMQKPRHAYSNLGFGLLGEAMAIQAHKPFLDLLDEKVIAPLGLVDTTANLNDRQKHRFVSPKNTKGKDVPPWTFDALAGAGCLRSSARDLIQFAKQVLHSANAPETTLERAICRSAQPLWGLGPRGKLEPSSQCSGWLSIKLKASSARMLHHDGATAGSTCTIYICPEKSATLGVLSNNCVGGNLWASTKLSWSNPRQQADDQFLSL